MAYLLDTHDSINRYITCLMLFCDGAGEESGICAHHGSLVRQYLARHCARSERHWQWTKPSHQFVSRMWIWD